MRTASIVLWNNQALAAMGSVDSNPIRLDQIFGYAVQVSWVGTSVGTFTLQGSCDEGTVYPDGSTSGINNWTTLAGYSASAAGVDGSALFNAAEINYQWVRLVYTAASGTAVADATISIKGV